MIKLLGISIKVLPSEKPPKFYLYVPSSLFFLDLGPVNMDVRQPAYRAGALCRNPTSSLIPIQNLISVHMRWRAGQLSEISLVYWRDLDMRDENFPYEHSILATETTISLLLMRFFSKQWVRVSSLTRVKFQSWQTGWNFSI